MDDLQGRSAQDSAASIGAANPKVIAELKLGRKLDATAPDFAATLAQALDKPYEELFDPKFGSPVFAGVKNFYQRPEPDRRIDASAPPSGGVTVATAPVLTPVVPIRPIVIPPWWPGLFTDLKYAVMGQFIVDVPTATAPVQGALGDCWLISAMASVAWCHSDAISERTLLDGSGVVSADGADYEFTFYASSNWSAGKNLSVRVDVPVSSSGLYIYACSSVANETWPANLEKAFIGMRGATGFLEPSSSNYDELNGGDPAWAVASLVGRPPYYFNANDPNAWSEISARCTNGRAVQPMTAWTYGSAPAGTSYDGSGIVGNHAYSILGTETSGGENYVVLRNPWGWHPATLNVLSGSWQGMTLQTDGVFALRMDTFADYYAGFGGA